MKKGNRIRTLSICLALAVFLGTTAAGRPQRAAAEAAAASPEEAVTRLEPSLVFPPDASVQATTTKLANYLVVISLKRANIASVAFDVTSSSTATSLHFFERKDTTFTRYSVTDNWETSRKLSITYEPYGNAANGKQILYAGFNSTATAATAKSHIAVTVTSGSLTSGASFSDAASLLVEKILLGDVTGDGNVNAADSLSILNYAAGKTTLTAAQKLAADVNRDGSINAADSMLIQQYAVSKILTFWGDTSSIISLSETLSGVENGGLYALKNVATGKYLYADSTGACRMGTISDVDNSTGRFTATSSGGLFAFDQVQKDGYHLQLSKTGYVPTCSTSFLLGVSTFWYAVPVSSGSKQFRLVNYAAKNRALSAVSSKCMFTHSLDNSVWTLEKVNVQVTINYFYDYGYRLRLNKGAVDSPSLHQAEIEDIIEQTFHVPVTMNTPQIFQSFADQCAESVTEESISDYYECLHTNPKDCVLFSLQPLPTCLKAHHRNAYAALSYLHSQKENKKDIQFLLSGYEPCSTEFDENGEVLGHAVGTIGGAAMFGYYSASVFFTDMCDKDSRATLTTLHEISHILGASKHNDCPADTVHNGGMCVMSYHRHSADLEKYWTLGQYRQLYCDDCYKAIVNYLKQF